MREGLGGSCLGRILGLMANLTEDPVLEINGIKVKEEDTNLAIDNKVVVREEGQGEREMSPPGGNSIHRSGSRPQLDLSKAAIEGNFEEKDPIILLPNQSDDISHLAVDLGGINISPLCFFIFRLFVLVIE